MYYTYQSRPTKPFSGYKDYSYFKYNFYPYFISKYHNAVEKIRNINESLIKEDNKIFITREEFLNKTNIGKDNLNILESLLTSEDKDNWIIANEMYKSLIK